MLESHYYEGKIEAGCDEAGRGCLAGSVYAAAVILPEDYQNELLNDSKQLSEKRRYQLREIIQQMPRQVKKAQVLGALTAMVGGAAGKPGVVGTGLLTASHTSTTSVLANVARLNPYRRHNMIKVNQLLNKNRIFVPDEDFDFVYEFLCQHCPKAMLR